MTVPRSETAQLDDRFASGRATAAAAATARTLQIHGSEQADAGAEYALLVDGDLEPVDEPSSPSASDPSAASGAQSSPSDAASAVEGASVTSLDGRSTLLSGTVQAEPLEFVLTGEILGVTVDGPEPTIALDDSAVDLDDWPSVDRAIHERAGEAPVENPFPNAAELSKPLGDPLDPREYVISLEAVDAGEAQSYAFDVEGAVLQHPDDATVTGDAVVADDGAVADGGETVTGAIDAGASATIEVRGMVTWIEADDAVELSIQPRE